MNLRTISVRFNGPRPTVKKCRFLAMRGAVTLLVALIGMQPTLAAEANWSALNARMAPDANKRCTASKAAVVVHSDFKQVQSKTGGCVVGSRYMAGVLASSEFALDQVAIAKAYLAPPPDLSKFIAEDAKAIGLPFRYAVEVRTPGLNFDSSDSSALTTLPDGRKLWRKLVYSAGAQSIDFAFAQLSLPAGAELFITSADRQQIRGPIRAADLQADGRYYSAFVLGDSAVLELTMTAAAMSQTSLAVHNLAHAYRDLRSAQSPAKSGSCNVDTVCPLGDQFRDQIDSVGHYTFRKDGTGFVCTGTLIANTRRDTTPNFLTANHCIDSEAVADTVVAYWNFQSSVCRTPGSSSSGSPLSNSIATHTQSGAQLLATSPTTDFTLLRLDSAVPQASGPYWSGWDADGAPPNYVVGIHHPQGHAKRIADSTGSVAASAYLGEPGSGSGFWRVPFWTNGTTEGGSSGSALFNQNRRIIGQLFGGFASCSNNAADYYGRISLSWNGDGTSGSRLRDWLDPINAGNTSLDGNRGTTTVPGGAVDEPSASGVPLPIPNPPNPSCPAGYFVSLVTDGPGAGLTPGTFGLAFTMDQPGTRLLDGGLNFGGLLDVGQAGFAGVNFANSANENQLLNLSLLGNPSNSATGLLPVRVQIMRQTGTTSEVVFEGTGDLSLATASGATLEVPPGFYAATVSPEGFPASAAGGAPEGQFFFELTTSFVNRPGGGFQGGAVVGGYHAVHPFGGVSSFAAVCLGTQHSGSVSVLSAPTYGAAGARDLRVSILDSQQQPVIVVPAN